MMGTPEPFTEGAGQPQLPGCAEGAAVALKQMFVDMTQGERISRGQEPAKRPVFLKPHGVARGMLTVSPTCRPNYGSASCNAPTNRLRG